MHEFFFCFVLLFSILQIYKDSQFNNTKIKKSKIQVQNKTQTLRKSYTFLNKVCTRRGHININNNNNNNNIDNNNNNNIYIYIYIYKLKERRERDRDRDRGRDRDRETTKLVKTCSWEILEKLLQLNIESKRLQNVMRFWVS